MNEEIPALTLPPGSAQSSRKDASMPEQSTPTSQPGAAETVSARQTIAWWALLVALTAGGTAAWSVWQARDTHTQSAQLRETLASRLAESESLASEARGIVRQQQETMASLQGKLGALESKVEATEGQAAALEALYQEFSRSREDGVVAEVEQAVALAAQQLQLAGNVEAALIALNQADARLATHDRGQYADVAYTPIHLMAAVVLEHLGYAVDYLDVSGPLPGGNLGDRYAGIVTWFTDDLLPDPGAYRAWLGAQLDSGMKVAILDHLGFLPDAALQQRLGLVRKDQRPKGDPQLTLANPEVTGFETKVTARRNVFYPLQISGAGSRRLLSVEDHGGARMDAVFTASWGGMAASPYLTEEGYDHSYRWIINPFAFFKQALQLGDLPAADVTTVNGRRILMVHIDGDGFPSRAQMPGNHYCGKVILDKVLKRYQIKTTVSIIEGEIGAQGKWPKLAPELEPIARDIFALPYVEVASHSYSHPFDLLRYGHDQEDGDINGMFRYDFSLKREIDGSVAYINQRLAPKDKPVKVFLWPGSAVAPLEGMARVSGLGIYNMNGGNSVMSVRRPSLTELSPMGRPIGPYYQVYAPVQNENVYTNLWRGPYYGFRDVISTFQLTDKPRRLKPINIYYHFYSGSKVGSLKVLQQAYQWALDQGATPLYASEYIRKVQDFQHLTLARRQDGCYQVRGDGELTTLRLDGGSKGGGLTLDRSRSQGVQAVHDLPQGRYVDLDSSGRSVVCMNPAGLSQKDAGQ